MEQLGTMKPVAFFMKNAVGLSHVIHFALTKWCQILSSHFTYHLGCVCEMGLIDSLVLEYEDTILGLTKCQ